MRIVVTTPNGNVGSRVVQLLVQAGVTPVVLLRDPDRLDPRWHGRVETVTTDQTGQAVHGPQDLTFTAAAQTLGDVLGHPVEPVRTGRDEFRAALRAAGLGPASVDAVAGMSDGLSAGFVAEDARAVTTTTPTTLAAWAGDHLRSAGTAAAA